MIWLFLSFFLQKLELTQYAVDVLHVLDTHLDILNAEVHFQLLQPNVTATLNQKRLHPEENLDLDTV